MQAAYDKEKARSSQSQSYLIQSFLECTTSSEEGMITIVTGLRDKDIKQTVSAGQIPTVTVLISAPDEDRAARGWVRTEEDLHDSETSFEPGQFDLSFKNDRAANDETVRCFVRSVLVPRLVGLRYLVPTCDLSKVAQRIPTVMTGNLSFKHVLALFAHVDSREILLRELQSRIEQSFGSIDGIVAVESGGFLLGGALATFLGKDLLIIRKDASKLPPPCVSIEYNGSFVSGGSGSFLYAWNGYKFPAGSRFVIVDDTISSGETASAAVALTSGSLNLKIVGVACILEFPYHRGREHIAKLGVPLTSIYAYDGP